MQPVNSICRIRIRIAHTVYGRGCGLEERNKIESSSAVLEADEDASRWRFGGRQEPGKLCNGRCRVPLPRRLWGHRIAGGSVAAAGVVCLSYRAYGWVAFFLALGTLNLVGGYWYITIARSASARV